MKNPNIKTRVVHSQTKSAWNVVGTSLGGKYKIASVPYVAVSDEEVTRRNRAEAFEHASFISFCFNQPNDTKTIVAIMTPKEKAAQLINQARLTGLQCKETNFYSFDLSMGKRIALMTVMQQLEEHSCETLNSERHTYWSGVKSEIENA